MDNLLPMFWHCKVYNENVFGDFRHEICEHNDNEHVSKSDDEISEKHDEEPCIYLEQNTIENDSICSMKYGVLLVP